MKKKAISEVPQIRTGIYRIPTRAIYLKTRLDSGKTWNEIYGSKRCFRCKAFFKEKDVYEAVEGERGKYQHVECPEVKTKKRRKKNGN